MSDRYILDASGLPQACEDLLTWGKWFETANRHVALTTIGDVRVSTVFLAIDHNFSGRHGHRPILWESMVFGGPLDGEQYRYESELQAKQGHDKLVELVKAAGVKTRPILLED